MFFAFRGRGHRAVAGPPRRGRGRVGPVRPQQGWMSCPDSAHEHGAQAPERNGHRHICARIGSARLPRTAAQAGRRGPPAARCGATVTAGGHSRGAATASVAPISADGFLDVVERGEHLHGDVRQALSLAGIDLFGGQRRFHRGPSLFVCLAHANSFGWRRSPLRHRSAPRQAARHRSTQHCLSYFIRG